MLTKEEALFSLFFVHATYKALSTVFSVAGFAVPVLKTSPWNVEENLTTHANHGLCVLFHLHVMAFMDLRNYNASRKLS